jgi:hypothetical protein
VTPFSLGLEVVEVSSNSKSRCGGGERATTERRLQRRREAVAEPRGCMRWRGSKLAPTMTATPHYRLRVWGDRINADGCRGGRRVTGEAREGGVRLEEKEIDDKSGGAGEVGGDWMGESQRQKGIHTR